MKESASDQLEAMIGYLLSGRAKWTVAKKMSGEIAALSIQLNDTNYIEALLDTNDLEMISVAVSALYLMGPLACNIAHKLEGAKQHPSEQTRKLASFIFAEYGRT